MNLTVLGGGVGLDESLVDESPAEIRRQVAEYAAGERQAFDLTVDLPDSFTGRVMEAMLDVPFGETRTYGELAAALDTSPIAVGGGCGRNPLPLLVPCHRVVASDGSLRGYSAPGGLPLKRRLLEHERQVVAGDRPTPSSRP